MLSGKKRTIAKMSQTGMFSGLSVLFAGLPSARAKVFTKIVISHGGHVVESKTSRSPLQTSSTRSSIHSTVTHIVVENSLGLQDLKNKLQCEVVPSSVSVVKCAWIEQCIVQKELLATASFEAIIPTAEIDANQEGGVWDTTSTSFSISSNTCSKDKAGAYVDGTALSTVGVGESSTSRSGSGSGTSSRDRDSGGAPIGHQGQCAGIILRYQDSIFMVQPTGSQGWGIPKGGVERGESLESAARREFFEETGIVLSHNPIGSSESSFLESAADSSGPKCDRKGERDSSAGVSDAQLTYLPGSGESIRGGKKIHAFVCNGQGNEVFVGSNLITAGYRTGLPENSAGRYVSIDEALHRGGGGVHKNQRRLLEIYAAAYL